LDAAVAVSRPDPRADLRLQWLLGGVVFALAVAVFLPIRNHEWLNYDDNVYVTQSDPVRAGWTRESAVWAFSSFDGANWFPLTRLSWMLDAELHGLDAGSFLVTNLLLHALASLALFAALARLTGNAWRSAFVAALFAVHPLHVESVAWVSARKDPLSGLFFALSLLVYAREREHGPSLATRVTLFTCAALGLMAKPIVVTLPFVLLLLDAWPLGRLQSDAASHRWDLVKLRAAVVEKLPLFALVGAFSAVTFLAQSSEGSVASLDQVSPAGRLGNALVSYVAYLGKAFWPARLAVFYPHAGADLPVGEVALAAALLLAVSLGVWRGRRSRPYLAMGWLWYLGTLVPVIGLVQVGSQAMADRYMYLPLIGLGIAVAWGASDACSRLPGRWAVLPVAACAAIAALGVTASLQLRHWRDSASLFRHVLEVTENNHVGHSYLGAALLERGQTGDAIFHYEEALRLRPDSLTVANNLAWLLATGHDASHRDARAAVEFAERAAQLTERRDPAVLDTLAAAYAASGRFSDATRTLRRAIEIGRSIGDAELVAELEQRLALYRARRPYIEGAP
jgi:tetratricopeptide (TPR) repeat protein